MEKELRRRSDNLAVLGTGVCFCTLWGIVRVLMEIFFDREIYKAVEGYNEAFIILAAVGGIILLILFVCIFPFFYVGLSARSEGLRGKRHTVYLGFAAVLSIFSFYAVVNDISLYEKSGIMDMVINMVIDLTVGITLIQVIINSVKVKKLRRMIELKEANNEQ